MKVFHIAETIKGGVATVLNLLLQSQQQHYNVQCLIPFEQKSELASIPEQYVSTFKRSGRNLPSFFRLFMQVLKIMWKDRPDIVHIHSSFAGFIARVSILILYPVYRPKVIYSPHAFAFMMSSSKAKIKIYSWIEKVFAVLTDSIVCTSKFEYQAAIDAGLPKKKLTVVYNGISIPSSFVKNVANNPYKDLSKVNVLYIGRFDYQKGYDILLKLINELDEQRYCFTLIGDFVHDKASKIDRSNVNYLGWLTYKEIIPYFQFATVLFMPSRWESFGLVAVEAQSFGLPVLGSDCSALPEVVLDGQTGRLREVGNIDQFKAVIEQTSKQEWQSMGEKGAAFVKQRFNKENMIIAMDRIYRDHEGIEE